MSKKIKESPTPRKYKTTPTKIYTIGNNQVFVFGSNISGAHGKGAAKTALQWGARYGQGVGLAGKTYAIPTKDEKLKTLPVSEIKKYVDDFVMFAKTKPSLIFLVTEIGCGLAGYTPKDIGILFIDAIEENNIYLPSRFIDEIILQK
jgi:hypothetical protein